MPSIISITPDLIKWRKEEFLWRLEVQVNGEPVDWDSSTVAETDSCFATAHWQYWNCQEVQACKLDS